METIEFVVGGEVVAVQLSPDMVQAILEQEVEGESILLSLLMSVFAFEAMGDPENGEELAARVV